MNTVRIGVIGCGVMGTRHVRTLLEGKVARCELTAVCDVDPKSTAPFKVADKFDDPRALIRSGKVDAVVISTPHYAHTTIGIEALGNGLHVMTEKPVSVHKADCERLLAAHTDRRLVFAAMFQQRTLTHFRKLKQFITEGELGAIQRISWTVTNWFRTNRYYANGGWRATWAGEGGGVLVNQFAHNLDMFQWLFGMPARVRGFAHFGKYHPIEVEDEITAYAEFDSGATATLVTNTGESPGVNRMDVAADRGRVVLENNKLFYQRNETGTAEFCKTASTGYGPVPYWDCDVHLPGHGGLYVDMFQNFVDAILDGKPLIAPAEEGIKSVELANTILYSSLTGRTIDLPLDGAEFEKTLRDLIAGSKVCTTQPNCW